MTHTPAKYEQVFLQDQLAASGRSARIVVPIVLSMVPARNVIDVGCGLGCWAAEFIACGAVAVGVDGNWIDRVLLQIPPGCFVVHDLRKEFRPAREFDLAVCLEVAEHLPESRAGGLVEDLVRLAPCVLFSAAVPGQGGTGHINEQPLSYWTARFAEHGYQSVDCIRPLIWDDARIDWWFRQNLVVFAKPGHPSLQTGSRALDLYHPTLVAKLGRRAAQPGLRICLKAFPAALGRAFKSRLGRIGRG